MENRKPVIGEYCHGFKITNVDNNTIVIGTDSSLCPKSFNIDIDTITYINDQWELLNYVPITYIVAYDDKQIECKTAAMPTKKQIVKTIINDILNRINDKLSISDKPPIKHINIDMFRKILKANSINVYITKINDSFIKTRDITEFILK